MEKYDIFLSLIQSWVCKISSSHNMYYEDRLFLFFIFYYFEILLRRSMISLFLLYRAGCAKFLQVTICITRIVFHLLIFYYYFGILLQRSVISLFLYRGGCASSILHLSTEGSLQLILNFGAERRIAPFAPILVHPLDFFYRFLHILLYMPCILYIYYKDRPPFYTLSSPAMIDGMI